MLLNLSQSRHVLCLLSFPIPSTGLDDFPLTGWRWITERDQKLLVDQNGSRCETTAEAFDIERNKMGIVDAKAQLNFLQKFLIETCSEPVKKDSEEDEENRWDK